MTDPIEPPAPAEPTPAVTAVCKECNKEYQTKTVYKLRGEKRIPYLESYWCSIVCRKAWNHRVRYGR